MTAAKPVVSTLFRRGTFTAGDSAATAAAIAGAARRRDFRDITQHGRGLTLPDRFGQRAAMASMLTPELAGERCAAAFNRIHGLETVALRLFNVFGPRQAPRSRYSDIARTSRRRCWPGGHDPRLSPPVHQIMLVVRRRASVRTGEPSPNRYVQ